MMFAVVWGTMVVVGDDVLGIMAAMVATGAPRFPCKPE